MKVSLFVHMERTDESVSHPELYANFLELCQNGATRVAVPRRTLYVRFARSHIWAKGFGAMVKSMP